MSDLYVCKFEDRISKNKLPKGLSYVLQTTDITSVLSTDGLALTYSYSPGNPKKIRRLRDFSFTKINLLSYAKYAKRWGEPGTIMDYDTHISVYSVPARIRYALRSALNTYILPQIKTIAEKYSKVNLSVYYSTFHKNNWEPLDWGGLYIEKDRYNDKAAVLYRRKEFDIDKEVKEVVK